MRTLVHLSDLHFGRTEPSLVEPLLAAVRKISPDVTVVSGDLTQRARSHQFEAAKRFLQALPQPQIVVPGNHDVPLKNLVSRLFTPLRKYRRYITDDLTPTYFDDEIAVIGVSTARSLVIKNGRINNRQIASIREKLERAKAGAIKVVVTHHPFDLDDGVHSRDLVGRAELAMKAFRQMGVDLLLAGHVHQSRAGNTATRYQLGDYSAVAVQSGTTLSTRRRSEANAFNVISTTAGTILVTTYAWEEQTRDFAIAEQSKFEKEGASWNRG